MINLDKNNLFHYLFLISIFFFSFVSVLTSFKYIALYDLSFMFNVAIFINEGFLPYKDFFLPYPELTFRIISGFISIFGKNLNIVYIWMFVSNLIFSKLIYDLSVHISKKQNTRYFITITSLLIGPYSGISQFSYDADAFLFSLITLRLILSKRFYNQKYFQFFVGFVASFNILFKQNIGLFIIFTTYLLIYFYFKKNFKNFLIGNITSGLLIFFYYLIQGTFIDFISQTLIYPSKSRLKGLLPFSLSDINLVDFAIFSICCFIILEYFVQKKLKYVNFYLFGLAGLYSYIILKHIDHPVTNSIFSFEREVRPIFVFIIFLIFLGLITLLENERFSKYLNSASLSIFYLGFYFLTSLNFRSIYLNDLFEHLRNLRFFLFYFILFSLVFRVFSVKKNVNLKIISLFFLSILISSQYSQGVNSFYALSSIFLISIFISYNNSQNNLQKYFYASLVFSLFFAFNFFGVNYEYFDTPKSTFTTYEERFLNENKYFIQDLNALYVLERYEDRNIVFYPNAGLVNLFSEKLYFNYFFQFDKTQNPYLFEDKNLWSRYFKCYEVEFVAISNLQQLSSQKYLEEFLLSEDQVDQVLGDEFIISEIIENFYIFENISDLSNIEIDCGLTSLEY